MTFAGDFYLRKLAMPASSVKENGRKDVSLSLTVSGYIGNT